MQWASSMAMSAGLRRPSISGKPGDAEAFRGDEEKIECAVEVVAAGLSRVVAGEAGADSVPTRGGRGSLSLGGLIVHEGDEGRDDEGCAAAGDGGELVAERFACAGGHDKEDVATVGGGAADGFLIGAEGRVAEGAVEQGAKVGHFVCNSAD